VKGYGRLRETRDPIDRAPRRWGTQRSRGRLRRHLAQARRDIAHGDARGRDALPRAHMLQTVDDDEFVGSQSARHHAQTIDFRTEFDQPVLDAIVLRERQHICLGKVRADGAILDKDAVVIFSADEAHARKQARRVTAVGVCKRGTGSNGPGRRVDLIVDEVELPGMWVAVFINQPDIDVGVPVARARPIVLRFRIAQISLFIGVEIDVNRIVRNERGQKTGTGSPGSRR